jgi:phosphate transport system permease protein
MLGMMRAIGETMVVWMASGNANQIPQPWWNITESVRTMTASIAGDMGETVKGSAHYRALFLLGLILLVFTFVLNLISEYFLSRVKRSMRGKD